MKAIETNFRYGYDTESRQLRDNVNSALSSTIGLLLVSKGSEFCTSPQDEIITYLQRRRHEGLACLKNHMSRVYKGFLLQFQIEAVDSPRVDLKSLLQDLPLPNFEDPFRDFFEEITNSNYVPTPNDLAEEFHVFETALTHLTLARAIRLSDINQKAFASLPFAEYETYWNFKCHPETVYDQISNAYHLADQLEEGGVDMTPNLKLKLLKTTHLLAKEVDIVQ